MLSRLILGHEVCWLVANSPKNKENEQNEKSCFVIMPISDHPDYPKGHFKEVYSELISPAVIEAGYRPVRADDVAASNLIHVDVIYKIIHADICICDLSSRNPNVMFEYGIRQAFDKPTILIKDDRTERIFDLSGMRDIEYNSSLRIAETLKKRSDIVDSINETVKSQGADGQKFSLVSLLGIAKAAQLPISQSTPETAQYKMITSQINSLQEMVYSLLNSSNEKNDLIYPTLGSQNFGKENYSTKNTGEFDSGKLAAEIAKKYKNIREVPDHIVRHLNESDLGKLKKYW